MRAKTIKEESSEEIQDTLRLSMKFFILFIIPVLLSACMDKPATNRNELLAGMYKLASIQVQDSAGVYHDEWASDGTGYIIYDGLGHMAVHITPKMYKDYKWVLSENETLYPEKIKAKMDSMSVDELKSAVEEFVSNYVYVANYSVSDTGDFVIHNRLSHTIPASWNSTVKRRFIFRGDTLELHNDADKRKLLWVKQQ
jgi:Lipocalin-like domain